MQPLWLKLVLFEPKSMASSIRSPPRARAPTQQEIDAWIQNYFEPLLPCEGREVGDVVLWHGFKGGNPQSTKVETSVAALGRCGRVRF